MASNTVGLGNIIVSGGCQSYFQSAFLSAGFYDSLVGPQHQSALQTIVETDKRPARLDFLLTPNVTGMIGLTSFLHLEVSSIPWTGEKIGITTSSLKFTLPGNDNLRTFGFGGTANVTLSTEENVITTQKETPAFNPIISFTAIADWDLIKKFPQFPAKVYFNYSNADNYRLHQLYHQHKTKLGFELKGERQSTYVKTGIALYVEKEPEDPYLKFYAFGRNTSILTEMGIGYRKRFTRRVPFTCLIDIEFDPIHPLRFLDGELSKSPQLSFAIEMPIYYKETHTEALRSLVFMEQSRKMDKKKITGKRRRASDLSLDRLMLENINRDLLDDEQLNAIFKDKEQEELLEKRKKIYQDLNGNDKDTD
ncbi:hypothetical protein ACFL5V_02720 [Fibrobacterota bacterium]